MDNEKQIVTPPADIPAGSNTEPGKKAYERPQIVYRAPLEAIATFCEEPTGKAMVEACGVANS